MIISASRRTDIPAFYSDWFFNRLKEGFCCVRNPMNPRQLSKITLTPDVVDCFVFWTKNPEPMLARLNELKDFDYYFQFTITPYSYKIEKNVPEVAYMVSTAHQLADIIGSDRVVWRYDPIFISKQYSVEEHVYQFALLARAMSGAAKRCVLSFYDEYKVLDGITQPTFFQIQELAAGFQQIVKEYNFQLETCSETFDLNTYGIRNGKCIDDQLISEIIGQPLSLSKDKGQRKECGCVTSIDIGAYSSCKHGCVYCYAQRDLQLQKHFSDSPLLLGKPATADTITERKMVSYKKMFTDELFC